MLPKDEGGGIVALYSIWGSAWAWYIYLFRTLPLLSC